jgi:hypothetical protein
MLTSVLRLKGTLCVVSIFSMFTNVFANPACVVSIGGRGLEAAQAGSLRYMGLSLYQCLCKSGRAWFQLVVGVWKRRKLAACATCLLMALRRQFPAGVFGLIDCNRPLPDRRRRQRRQLEAGQSDKPGG